MESVIEKIARACHEANRAICETYGDHSQKPWEQAEGWQRESAVRGVRFALENPDAPASAQHDAWSEDKIADGWTYGEVKDAVAKTHPCLVPFADLPAEQRVKDAVFKAIVNALADRKDRIMTTSRIDSTDDKRVENSPVRHTYRQLSDAEKARMVEIKDLGAAFIQLLHELGATDPQFKAFASRDLQLANDHMEDAVMRAVRHLTA